jgi:hypothetical protein
MIGLSNSTVCYATPTPIAARRTYTSTSKKVQYVRDIFSKKVKIQSFNYNLRVSAPNFTSKFEKKFAAVGGLKGQSHEKVGEIRVEGDSQGPN